MENTKVKKQFELAEIQLSYKITVKPSSRPKIRTSKDTYEILLESWDDSRIEFVEQFKVMFLNRANKVLGIFEVSTGGVAGTVADPKVIFAAAIKTNASGMILSHNHPSGNLIASKSDIELTKRLKEGGRLLEIELLDHVIISTEGYFSFAD
jgi:DNA repair protein RadC